MSRISKLSKLSNISRIGTSTSSTLRRAFGFDGTDDYISSNATIGRTGYDMNVSGNVSTGSDADGSYFNLTYGTGYISTLSGAVVAPANLNSAFTIEMKIKTGSDVTTLARLMNNVTSSSNRVALTIQSGELRCGIYNGSAYIGKKSKTFATNTLYVIHYTWDGSSVGKLYINGTEETTVPAGDPSATTSLMTIGGPTNGFSGFLYNCAIRNKALTQAEVDADIALGNTAKSDPTIVAYYIPENLQYNTQYMTNPKALDQSPWSLSGASTVTADTTVAPDGTTTADTVAISGTATQGIEQPNLTITGATIASKTFIVKAFVKVTAGTALFRLKMSHRTVADYFSSNQTATTDWQEFTFTQTFTSSTGGTGIIGGVSNDTGATNPTLLVRNVRVFLTNETLRDESPNIGGYIGWKTQKVLSCRFKPNADFANSADAGCLISQPRAYLHDRSSTHQVQMRFDNRVGARTSFTSLGSGYRAKTHVLGLQYRTGSTRATKLYINGALLDSDTHSIDAPTAAVNFNMRSGRKGSTYFSGNIRDARIYTFTGSFTDADALAIYNGGEPTSSGVTKHLHYKPPVGEVGTTTQDQSTNDRDGTLNGGVTRDYI